MTGRLAIELLGDLAPNLLFLSGAFMVSFPLFKLFVAQYEIQSSAFTRLR